ncbi:MAG: hypothetical protein M3Y41_22070 [Pseudomonadota bacterium]|nr:hypothetical protein [Pseudomonadota bacterium]
MAAQTRSLAAHARSLEERLAEIEGALNVARPHARPHRVEVGSAPAGSVGGATARQAKTPRLAPPQTAATTSTVSVVAAPDVIAPGATPTGSPPSVGVGRPSDAPQETFVFRENAVTLQPRRAEISTEVGYVHSNGFLQSDRAFTSATSLRLGLLDWLELNATVPAFATTRTRGIGPFQTQSREVSGLGDVLLQANARVHEQTAVTPGVVVSLGALLPTGAQPYDFRTYQPNPSLPAYRPDPTDLSAAYFSRGAGGVVTNLQFYKTVDPLILFFGAGVRRLFTQRAQGHDVQPGLIYTYNFGFSFALSEKSTLGLQVIGSYENKLAVDGRAVPQSDLEPVVVRVSLIQRIFPQTWLEPALTAGLTSNAPGLGIALGVRHRF